MNQFYPFAMKACTARALKTAALFIFGFVWAQQSMAQSASGQLSGDKATTASFHPKSFLNVRPGPEQYYISVGHPAGGNDAQLKLVDTNGKILQQVAVGKNSLQTKLPISGLANGDYKIVWSDGTKTVEQPLLIL